MTLILCGLPTSGKTCVGRLLSVALQSPFVDTDQLIETAYTTQTGETLSCHAIYKQKGASYFRMLEQCELSRLESSQTRVIATGGGLLDTAENVELLKQLGTVIYLQTPLSVLWERILLRGLPAYLDPQNPQASFEAMANRRIPLYEQAASIVVNARGLTVAQITDFILLKITDISQVQV